MHVIGTAGHVDHGKSALVAALTGTNPDRLAEERERGMTLDLGFAHLVFDDGVEGGIVDVPGHERFLHNMLAGAAGMELLLLVVDGSEGVMPQTREHLTILRFLNVRRVFVVVSKIDLVGSADREAAIRRIERQLQGSIAEDAPHFAISAVTGEGLVELKAALHRTLGEMPHRNASAPVYLPIDRAFSMAGLGTIVTGTLMQGRIETGEVLRLEPGGERAHVRSIGVFGSVRKTAQAGSRVALNLPGIDRNAIARGHAVVGTEFRAARSFAVRFTPLPESSASLRRRTPVRAYIGSAEVLGTLVASEAFEAERETRAELHLREPVVAFAGVRFVLRRVSPMTLLGGGYVEGEEVAPAADDESANETALRSALANRGLAPAPAGELCVAVNLREADALEILERLVERGDVLCVARPLAYVDAASARELLARVLAQLAEAHQTEPWAMGVTSLALARALDVSENVLVRILGHFAGEGRLVNRAGYYATTEHRPSPTPQQRAFFDEQVSLDASQPFLPVPFTPVATAVKRSQLAGIAKAFETMLASGTLVKVGDDLYRGSQIAQIRALVEAHLRAKERMTAADFRDLIGTSRKYAVPLLEWLDAHGVTIRTGDIRTLRKH
ncbi:MAG: selenocysteine-specific translation elongation factor [Candidatus Cybelea sp.]